MPAPNLIPENIVYDHEISLYALVTLCFDPKHGINAGLMAGHDVGKCGCWACKELSEQWAGRLRSR